MNNKISFLDLQPSNMQIQMTTFVKRFTPRSWWPHLMPKMVQLWAMILQRTAFGEVNENIFETLHLYGKGHGGVGTWWADAEGVYYTWTSAGICSTFKLPEWGIGVWRDVSSAFQRSVTPFADWSDDFMNADMDALAMDLVQFSKGRRVFEALGILGGIWEPESVEAL